MENSRDAVTALIGNMMRDKILTEFIMAMSVCTNNIDGTLQIFCDGGSNTKFHNFFNNLNERPYDFPEFDLYLTALNLCCREFLSSLQGYVVKYGVLVPRPRQKEHKMIFRMILKFSGVECTKLKCISFGPAINGEMRRYTLAMVETEHIWAHLNAFMNYILLESLTCLEKGHIKEGVRIHATEVHRKDKHMIFSFDSYPSDSVDSVIPYPPRAKETLSESMPFLKPVLASLVRRLITARRRLPEVNLSLRLYLNFVKGPTHLTFCHRPFSELQQVLGNSQSEIDGYKHYEKCVSFLKKSCSDFTYAVQQDLKRTGLAPARSSDEVAFELSWWNMVSQTSRISFGSDMTESVQVQSLGRSQEKLIWAGIENLMYFFLAKAYQALDHNQGRAQEHAETNSRQETSQVPDGADFDLDLHSHTEEDEHHHITMFNVEL